MPRKNTLNTYHLVTSTAMTSTITSPVTEIQFMDNIGYQFNVTGNATGTFAVQVSADYKAAPNGAYVISAGNWIPLTLPSTPTVSGTDTQIYVDINQLSAPWIRFVYTSTFVESGSITTVADTAGSLNNTYFLINGANGTNWYIWFNVNSAGTDPMIAGRTGVSVALSTGASANTVASGVRTALASVTSVTTIGGSTNHATFVQSAAGHGSLTDGAVPTLFTLNYTTTTGVLNAYVVGKEV